MSYIFPVQMLLIFRVYKKFYFNNCRCLGSPAQPWHSPDRGEITNKYPAVHTDVLLPIHIDIVRFHSYEDDPYTMH